MKAILYVNYLEINRERVAGEKAGRTRGETGGPLQGTCSTSTHYRFSERPRLLTMAFTGHYGVTEYRDISLLLHLTTSQI